MQVLHSLESKVADVAKGLPHLPKEFQKWLAENAWWLTLIGVVIGAFGIFALLPLLTAASVVTSVVDTYYPYSQALAPSLTSVWVSLGFLVAIVVIEGLAVSPLKGLKKHGWDLIFLAVLVSAASSLVSALLTSSFYGLFGAALGLAIGLYVLFEVRSHFTHKAAAKK